MKILYVISTPIEYSSSANMRNIALINGLINNDCVVDLLSDGYNTNSKYVDDSLCEIKFRKRYYLRKVVAKGDINKDSVSNKMLNKLKELCSIFVLKFSIYDNRKVLVNNVKKNIIDEKYDLIISSSDPKSSHLLAEEVIKCNPGITKKWIQYWGDPFANDINNRGFVPKSLIRKEEKRLIALADVIVYVSPFTLETQQKLYSSLENKMKFSPIPYKLPKVYKTVFNKVKKVGYFGDFYSRSRNILPLYNSFDNSDFELVICGNSDVNLTNKENINVFKRQSIKKVEELESQCDLLVCVCNSDGTQIPGKIYHYAATNKPILIILDGNYKDEIKKYLESFNRFAFCNNDASDINMKINDIFEKNIKYTPCKRLGSSQIAREFLSFIESSEKND